MRTRTRRATAPTGDLVERLALLALDLETCAFVLRLDGDDVRVEPDEPLAEADQVALTRWRREIRALVTGLASRGV